MGVTHTACSCCNRGVNSEFTDRCSKCEQEICVYCLVKKGRKNSDLPSDFGLKFDGSKEQKEQYGIETKQEDPQWGMDVGDVIDDVGYDPKYCPFCTGKKVNDTQLLNFILELYEFDKEEVKRQYLKSIGVDVVD